MNIRNTVWLGWENACDPWSHTTRQPVIPIMIYVNKPHLNRVIQYSPNKKYILIGLVLLILTVISAVNGDWEDDVSKVNQILKKYFRL